MARRERFLLTYVKGIVGRGVGMANILVVEDEEQIRVLAGSLCEEMGHTAASASNMDEALALLATDEVFDLIFTDLSLHGHDQAGLALATEAVRIRYGIPVLYTTGQAVTDGMKAMFVEGSSFLPKPYTFDQLNAAVTAALKSK